MLETTSQQYHHLRIKTIQKNTFQGKKKNMWRSSLPWRLSYGWWVFLIIIIFNLGWGQALPYPCTYWCLLSWDDIVLVNQIQSDNTFCLEQNTIEGRIVFCPQVGRLNCGSSSIDQEGYWELEGYGLVGVYKSDWIRFGGKLCCFALIMNVFCAFSVKVLTIIIIMNFVCEAILIMIFIIIIECWVYKI